MSTPLRLMLLVCVIAIGATADELTDTLLMQTVIAVAVIAGANKNEQRT